MAVNSFLLLLLIFSIVTSFVMQFFKQNTEIVKKVSYNVIVLIISIVVGGCGGISAYILLSIPFTAQNIVSLILMIPAIFFASTIGYDKVSQTIAQIVKIGGSV